MMRGSRGTSRRVRPIRLPIAALLSLLAVTLVAACGSALPTGPAPPGVLTGHIFILGVPTPPDGPPSPAGTVTVFASGGRPSAANKVVARVHVRAGEQFQIEVPGGSYLIAAEVLHKSSCAPAVISVAPNLTSSSPVLVGCNEK